MFKKNQYLFLVGGPPGVGKSYISSKIAKHVGPLIDKDTISNTFTDSFLVALGSKEGDRESELYLNKIRPLEYATLKCMAEEALEIGHSAVCTAPFYTEFFTGDWLKSLEDKTKSHKAKLILVWVTAPKEDIKQRLISRGSPRDEWKLKNWDTYSQSIDTQIYKKRKDLHIINNSKDSVLDIEIKRLFENVG